MRSVSVWLGVQGQSAELNWYFVWEIIYWKGRVLFIVLVTKFEIKNLQKQYNNA
jgi:hypothetical protein